jgi:hypothetical protein
MLFRTTHEGLPPVPVRASFGEGQTILHSWIASTVDLEEWSKNRSLWIEHQNVLRPCKAKAPGRYLLGTLLGCGMTFDGATQLDYATHSFLSLLALFHLSTKIIDLLDPAGISSNTAMLSSPFLDIPNCCPPD